MLTKPRWILHLEGAAIFIVALCFYRAGHYPWWLFAALFLVPDVSMIGFVKNARWGSAIYNLVHTLTLPLALLGGALILGGPRWIPYALVWLAHIGFDRALGYGLKYPTVFKDTHLQHV
ncbi:MAG: DUF4260 domain-containing protein [Candidatus Acidiferrales bacterium]